MITNFTMVKFVINEQPKLDMRCPTICDIKNHRKVKKLS